MPKAYILIGLPGSGKSTWAERQGLPVTGSDRFVEHYAKVKNSTYNKQFNNAIKWATAEMHKEVDALVATGSDFIWDQTSLTKASRKMKLKKLPGYTCIAVVFPTGLEEVQRRLSMRTDKNISDALLLKMLSTYEAPCKEEGFADVWYFKN